MNDPEAALRRLNELTRSLPARLAEATAQAADLGRQEIDGSSTDETVTVTVDGGGTVTGVRFSAVARRRLDSATLGEHVAEAVNAALDAAERQQRPASAAEGGLEQALDEVLDTLNYRLDGVLNQLDQVERGLES
jgi:DNA-binding protein YbaB